MIPGREAAMGATTVPLTPVAAELFVAVVLTPTA